jgi:nucleotide-binding universal stress UspA family protein
MQVRHLLAPTDFSEYSKQAVVSALELARTLGAKLTMLHVVELPPYPVPYPVEGYAPPAVHATWPTFLDDLERQATQNLAQLVPEAESSDVEVARLVAVGSPHRKIIDTAEAAQVDLIVMATAGRSGFSRLLMGSIAERVVRTAPCPVLTIRPRE